MLPPENRTGDSAVPAQLTRRAPYLPGFLNCTLSISVPEHMPKSRIRASTLPRPSRVIPRRWKPGTLETIRSLEPGTAVGGHDQVTLRPGAGSMVRLATLIV